MRFVVAGGGFAGLAAALCVARAGHEAVLVERDGVEPRESSRGAFEEPRRGIPHFLQPHAFLPRGRRELRCSAPDVLEALLDAGAEPQDLSAKLRGSRQAGDEDLVYLWVRRPVVEWALRRAAGAEPGVTIRPGCEVDSLLVEGRRAVGVGLADGGAVRGDVVVDALGRYRTPPGWPRPRADSTECGAIYFCRYFRLVDGVDHLEAPLLNPRGDLGYMAFNTFRGDDRTYAIILLAPSADRELRALRDEPAWTAACAAIRPLDEMTLPDRGVPVTGVMPMGGLMNADRTGDSVVRGVVAVGDALCHTDPAFAYGLSFSLAHGAALARASAEAPDPDAVVARYREDVCPEARERFALACATDDARTARWRGEPADPTRRDGSYPLFSFVGALAAAPHDDRVLRRTIGRVGLLDRTEAFDRDGEVHARIEEILAAAGPPAPAGPPRDELLARLAEARA